MMHVLVTVGREMHSPCRARMHHRGGGMVHAAWSCYVAETLTDGGAVA